MKKWVKRLSAMLLVIMMVLSLIPTSVFATSEFGVDEAGEAVTASSTEEQTDATVEEQQAEEPAAVSEIQTVSEAPTDTPAETPAETTNEVSMPEQYFDETLAGTDIRVLVTAPKGAFPEGTVMKVAEPRQEAVDAAIEAVEDADKENVVAVDITFENAEGTEELQPQTDISVQILTPELEKAEDYSLVHIDDNNNAEVVADEKIAELSDEGVTFETDAFSVYVIVAGGVTETPRYTYHFLNEIAEDSSASSFEFVNKAGNMVSTQIIKDGETLEPVPGPASGVEKPFSAWYIATKNEDGTYTLTNEQLSFDTPISVSEDKDIYVAPFYGDSIIATFYDKVKGADNNNIVTKRVVPLIDGEATVQVDNISVPTTATTVLSGWTVDGADYPLDTYPSITATENINLYPIFSEGHWIRFVGGESGSGAEYVTAIFVTANTKASELTTLTPSTREGYTFDGWYYGSQDEHTGVITYGDQATDASGTVSDPEALLATAKTQDVYLFGKWAGNSVKYRVAIWYENADDTGYSFQSVSKKEGSAGTTTNVTAEPVSGFTAQTIEQQTIKGDGSTIVNIYYKRNIYDIRFYNRSGEISALTISAKYGADIHGEWPGVKEGTSQYSSLWRVRNGNALVAGVSTMPINGAEYNQISVGIAYQNTKLMVQNIDGTNNFTQYVERPFAYSEWLTTSVEDYTPIKGFSLNAYSDSDAQAIRNGAGNSGSDPNATYNSLYERSAAIGTSTSSGERIYQNGYYYRTLYFYYLRNKYNLVIEENGGPQVNDITGIYYEANISEAKSSEIEALNQKYVVDQTTKTVPGSGQYVFKGWYDNRSYIGEPFDFDQKMPAGNITLYAKWERVWYLVEIDPNGGEISAPGEVTYTWLQYGDILHRYNIQRNYVEDANGEYQYFNVKYPGNDNDTIQSPQRKARYVTDASSLTDGQKIWLDKSTKYKEATSDDYYSLVGWYNTDTGAVYDFSSEITGPTSIQARWRRSGTYNIWYNAVTTVGKAHVFGTIQIEQDAGYADKANTTILNKPSDIKGDDGKGYVFKGWQLVNNFTDCKPLSDTLYQQGDDFLVDATQSTDHELFLLAVYEPADNSDEPVSVTNLIFDPNGAEGQQVVKEGLPVNDSFDLKEANGFFERPGYKLVGWSQNKDAKSGDADVFTTDTVIGVDNLDPMETITEDGKEVRKNILYAIWDSKFYVFHSSDGSVDTYTANDLNEDGKFDITARVKDGHLYGGYYRDYSGKGSYAGDGESVPGESVPGESVPHSVPYTGGPDIWNASDAYTEAGTAISTVAGTTYYLKEVPEAYIQASNYEIYHKKTKVEKEFYLVTAIDDNNYKEVGFKIGATNTDYKSTLAEKIELNYKDKESTDFWNSGELTVSDFNAVEAGYVAYVKNNKIIDKAGASLTYRPYYKTLDGVTVFGKLQKTARSNRNIKPVTFDSITITNKSFW